MRAAVVFPGQGSQFVGMADPWAEHEVGRSVLEEATATLGRDEDALSNTGFLQPAILACDVAAFRVMGSLGAGFGLVGVAGHSLGEFAALVAAGTLALPDALALVVIRGRAMQEAGEQRPGGMTALLGVGAEEANALCDDVREGDILLVANENSPQQVVISGSVPAIERAEALAAGRRIRAIRLRVAGAFHSPLMEPAVAPLAEAIDATPFAVPQIPVAANVTGTLVEDPEELRALLKRHVISPVRWERCAQALAGAGADTFVEAGPGDVLTKLAKRIVPGARAVAVGSPEDAAALLDEV